jgi:hypothetical protein
VVIDNPSASRHPLGVDNTGAVEARHRLAAPVVTDDMGATWHPVHDDGWHDSTEVKTVRSIEEHQKNVKIEQTEERVAIIEGMISTVDEKITDEQKNKLRELLSKYSTAFSFGEWDLGCTNLIRHEIDTGDAKPCRQRLRRQPPSHDLIIKEQIDTLLQQGVIEPAQSPWASNVVIVKKKDGKFRMCIDYRSVNDLTRKDSYGAARVDTALDALSGSTWFPTLDLRSSYHQILVDEKDRDKTAWICKFGQYRYCRMPFGMYNSGATFQRLIDLVLSGISYISCLSYVDDIIVFSKSFDEHLDRLSAVLQRISDANLTCRPDKCVFMRSSVEFLGHVASADGVAIVPSSVEAVASWPRPKCVREVREILGLMSYYRKHIKGFADLARPMTDLLKGDNIRKFQWNVDADDSFERLKSALVTAPILAMPNDMDEFVLDTDASLCAIGAVLGQRQNGVERVIAYGSRRLKNAESNYCTTRRELLAIVHFIRYFRCYLLGRRFVVRTDHAALVWLRRIAEPVGQQARWLEELENYDFVVERRSGKSHSNADVLSRRPDCNRHHDRRKCPLCDAEFIMGGQCIVDAGQKIPVEADGVGKLVTAENGRAQGMNGTAYSGPSVPADITVSEVRVGAIECRHRHQHPRVKVPMGAIKCRHQRQHPSVKVPMGAIKCRHRRQHPSRKVPLVNIES